MLPLLLAAAAPLAELAGSEVAKLISGNDPAAGATGAKVASTLVSTAAAVAGVPIATAEEAHAAAQTIAADPAKLAAFRQQATDAALAALRLDNEDRASARSRDLAYVAAGRRNWRADVLVGLAVAGVIACVLTLVFGKVDGSTAVGGFVISVGSLLAGKIGTAFDFEFGSSAGSQAKDALMRRS